MSIFNFFKPKKRGFVYTKAVGVGLINKGEEIEGYFEVEILDEANDMYKIKFVDLPIYEKQWVKKNLVKIIKS
jgi:hypothetical protein